jgi:16S rRNA pseudouridine516 synthase
MALIRLDKFLADRTPHSRAEVKKLLRAGAVLVDGKAVSDPAGKIDPEVQEVRCAGKLLRGAEQTYLLLNKPEGVVSATEDRDHKTVIDLVPTELRIKGLFPAGRLDADSTGMLLLTNDGELTHRMLSPKHHVPKFYLVQLDRPFETIYREKFESGITLSDGTECLPAQIEPLDVPGNFAVVCLHEGKYHQVKRMVASVGNHVLHLHRIGIGGLILPPDLPLGGTLELFHKDIDTMLKTQEMFILCERIMSDFSSYLINAGI